MYAELRCSELEHQRVSEQNYFEVPGSWGGMEKGGIQVLLSGTGCGGNRRSYPQKSLSRWQAEGVSSDSACREA